MNALESTKLTNCKGDKIHNPSARLKEKLKLSQTSQKSKALGIGDVSNSVCDTIKHRMTKSGIYKECPNCGEKFEEADCTHEWQYDVCDFNR